MGEGDKRPPDRGSSKPPELPGLPRRRLPVALILLVLVVLSMMLRSFGGSAPAKEVRYDQFLHYVREDRVQWVRLGEEQIEGSFREGRVPEELRGEGDAAVPARFRTGRLEDEALLPLLDAHHVAFRYVPASGWAEQWPWLVYLGVSIAFLFLFWGGMLRRMGAQQGGVLSFGKNRGRVFMENEVSVTFDDVAGVPEAKEELQEVISFLRDPEKYRRIGARIPKGVLLLGPPGTGKTLLARAVAGEAKVPFISISGSEFVEMFVGVGAARVRDLFDQAAKAAPAIVFIDELDALGRSRGGAALGGGTNEEREQTLNQLLVEMDGFEPREAVIIMAATNRPEVLDPALLRAGRFDRQVLVDRPDRVGRRKILDVHVRKVKLASDVDLDEIAASTPGLAGADLANLVNEAALLAAREGHETVAMQHFSSAIDRVIAGLEKKTRVINDDERRRVAYHEVGHALTATLAGSDDRVRKISIVPRGMAALGFTMQLPTEERYLMTASSIRAKLVGLLGGRASEELVFGEPSTGAQDDLRKATDIARAMVVEYGLSEAVGPISVSAERPVFLRGRGGEGIRIAADVGETLANTIDVEVRRIVEEAHGKASDILRANRAALDRITAALIEKEVLEGPMLTSMLDEAREEARRRAAAE